jgi:hypothetical protein
MRAAGALGALALLLAACSGTSEVEASASPSSSSSPTSSPSPVAATPTASAGQAASPTSSASPTPEPVLRLPSDAPISYDGAVSVDGPFEPLAPPGAEVLDAWFQEPSDEVQAFAWVVWGRGDDPFARELGVVLWERFGGHPTWRATHAFTDEPPDGVLGISLETADVTRDGFDDALTFEQTGGSGACGTWRVVAPFHGGATLAMKRQTCDAEISIVGDHLELREAVYEPDDAHCCPSAFRTTTLQWDGETFVATAVREEATT